MKEEFRKCKTVERDRERMLVCEDVYTRNKPTIPLVAITTVIFDNDSLTLGYRKTLSSRQATRLQVGYWVHYHGPLSTKSK